MNGPSCSDGARVSLAAEVAVQQGDEQWVRYEWSNPDTLPENLDNASLRIQNRGVVRVSE